MNYIQFKKKIQKRIPDFLQDRFLGYDVDIQTVIGNNGVVKDKLIMHRAEQMSPAICLKEYFGYYKAGETMEYLLGRIANGFQQDYAAMLELGRDSLQYEKIRDRLTVAACNAEMNEERLKNIPHETREDLALVYHIRQKQADGEVKTILVDNRFLDIWKIGEETLKEDAWKSMKKENAPCFRSMEDILGGLFSGSDISINLYVLSNQDEIQGAAYMFDVETMRGISERFGKSLIVFPASIHETIILPDENELDLEEMQQMVRSINGTELDLEDVLSNQVYRFDKDTQELSMMVSPEQTIGMGMNM